jgi:hypothetical protein
MREVVARRAGVAQRRQAEREAELLCHVRRVYADLQQSGQPVQVKTIAKAVGLGPAALRAYPAVRAELARIRANTMSRYQWERHQRETDLLTRLDEYVQQCEEQEQPLLISAIAQKLAMPLATILGYPRLRERIEQIRSMKREQRRSGTERMERSI